MFKRHIEDLALFGGPSLFAEELHVGRPNIGSRDRFLARMNDIFDRRWLTNDGPYLEELESRLAERLHVKYCLAVCNATIGLEIAAQALGLLGEVILPSFTFVATAHAMRWLGLTPVFCDIDPSTHNLDAAVVKQLITPRTSGILGVHVWGRACSVDKLRAVHYLKQLRIWQAAAVNANRILHFRLCVPRVGQPYYGRPCKYIQGKRLAS